MIDNRTQGTNQSTELGSSRKRRLPPFMAWMALFGLVGLAIELVSTVGLAVMMGRLRPIAECQARRKTLSLERFKLDGAPDNRPEWIQAGGEVIHPYLGYVLDPTVPATRGIHPYGFHDLNVVFEAPRDDRLIVGIFGGSVAGQVWEGRAALEEELRRSKRFRDQEIHIIRVALAGFKQPQQCLAFQYLLALGAHFDIVITFDGFNDVVLPWVDNAQRGVFPFYPRAWAARTANLTDAATLRAMGVVEAIGIVRRRLAHVFSVPLVRWSFTGNLVWYVSDNAMARAISRRQEVLNLVAARSSSYLRTGPDFESDPETVYEASANLWAAFSRYMNAVAQANGIAYLHFLQPNQYVPGSKPLSAEEKRIAFRPETGYGPYATAGYPFLIRAGQDLVAARVPFWDLTMLFADEERTVYKDSCCHMNDLGRELMARQVGITVRETMANEPLP